MQFLNKPNVMTNAVPRICSRNFVVFVCAVLLISFPATAEADHNEDLKFFETRVRPLLAEHCFECHGTEKQKGQLRLDSAEGLLTGGESGDAVLPGDPDASLLIQAVRWESYEMPPGGKLPASEIEILEDWVRRGAKWPGADPSGTSPKPRGPVAGFTDEDRSWWAIQPLSDPQVPRDPEDVWSRNEIDRFLYEGMKQNGLTPAPEADRETLIRRLSFDLIGLPPAPEQVEEFVNDSAPDAWEKLVDRLLASPQYGERWARLWLDVVRYADSDGYRIDHYRPDSWKYRDYVIRSLNADKPYDRFVQEQVAGDELFPDSPDALIATGYMRHWIYEYNNRDVRGQWDLILNEITDTTGDVFLGVGLQCARCHDHKYDPILQKDYYRLRAFFEAIRPDDQHVIASTAEQRHHAGLQGEWESKTAEVRQKIAAIENSAREKARQDAIEKFPADIQAILLAGSGVHSPLDQQLFELAWRQVDYEYVGLDNRIKGEQKDQLLALRRELARFDDLRPEPLLTAMVVTDVGPIAPATRIPKRRTETGPGILSILDSAEMEIPPLRENQQTTGRRAALADWLTRPDNPLSTRVIVNRIWQGHFGRGLAQNASDFGMLGGPPVHPQLLDWLTLRFVRNGWQMKDLHRLIVTSAAWRQGSEHPMMAEYQNVDPTNRFYWKFSTRRLDAEQIRDAILFASGQIDLTEGGPGVQSDVPRRSIYLRVMRNERDSLLDVFDLPLFFSSTSSRDTTTSPIQSLLLLNSQMMMNHAVRFAEYVAGEAGMQDSRGEDTVSENVVTRLWQRAFSRQPTEPEVETTREFLRTQRDQIRNSREKPDVSSMPVGRLPYRDGQAVVINPDDQPMRMVAVSAAALDAPEFTLEACLQLRSIHDTGAVRTIAAKWSGDSGQAGWAFGITGKGSRRRPQTLVMQMFGRGADGKIREAAIFSDQIVDLNTPWYVGVSVTPPTDQKKGTVIFRLKNLSDDDVPMHTVVVEHDLREVPVNSQPLTLGFRAKSAESSFDGLLDDVRLSSSVLTDDQLLLHSEPPQPATLAFWRFEPVPGLLEDSTVHARRLTLQQRNTQPLSPEMAAMADLCHAILNANEFLYVR